MWYRERVPAFVDRDNLEEYEFSKWEDAYNNIQALQRFKSSQGFTRFSTTPFSSFPEHIYTKRHLMAEFNNNDTWYVIGTITGTKEEIESLPLAIWECPPQRKDKR